MANRRNIQPYKPIEVSYLGEQKVLLPLSSRRISKTELDDVCYWRNNLVAASKRHNYLFIAVCSTIRVYAPKYPYQTIPTATPYTTITSAASSPTATGYIDHREPHAINSLTVGELGFEEVLVSAHDDGDVCAWYTRDLQRIAFRLNVRVSAWGVALHKERRLLAVSANTHLIQVFELAIGRNPEDGEEGVDDVEDEELVLGDKDYGNSPHNGSRKRRRRRRTESRSPGDSDESGNDDDSIYASSKRQRKRKSPVKDKTVKTLIGHNNNIPNISFLDDPSGRWLVGTSIDGTVILWDVVTERAVEECTMYNSVGWSVIFLKPQAFKPVSTLYEALGKPAPDHFTHKIRKTSIRGIRTLLTDYYDPSTNQRSREARAWEISPPPFSSSAALGVSLVSNDGGFDDDEDDYWEDEDEEGTLQSSVDADDLGVFIGSGDGHIETITEEGSETDASVFTATTYSQEGEAVATYHSVAPSVTGATEIGFSFEEDGEESDNVLRAFRPINVAELSQNSEGEGEKASREADLAHGNGRRRKAHDEGQEEEEEEEEEDEDEEEKPAQPPISFIFSTTKRNCHLLTLTPYLTPTVICRDPLYQIPSLPSLLYHAEIDRLNMVHCIPDLSLIIAASQKGRVAIFRLTRFEDTFCMRLDTIIPREDQVNERGRERRPPVSLLGVAVSPVQERRRVRGGGVGVWGRRRWRLMMVYMDGTIASYELGREAGIVEVGGIGGGLSGMGGFVMV